MKHKIMLAFVALLASINLNAQSGNRLSNVLIVYYSRSGNTQAMAKMIQAATRGDLVAVRLVKDYPSDYGQLVKQYIKNSLAELL